VEIQASATEMGGEVSVDGMEVERQSSEMKAVQ